MFHGCTLGQRFVLCHTIVNVVSSVIFMEIPCDDTNLQVRLYPVHLFQSGDSLKQSVGNTRQGDSKNQ